MNKIIEIKHLCKSFGDIKAVDDISFCVKEGELFAFLGVNGAGKSTTINIMCGQLSKDSGNITINNCDLDNNVDDIKSELGVVFQSSVLDSALSVYDNLESRAALYGIVGKEFKERLSALAK
ncbi:MAG: ABC transporter ATP-binding protein, partial [Clostridia bacterium]|nr:ABC transporter ATP-binding protein [Clostridia bacterium]